MRNFDLAFFDLETTGLSFNADIIEMAVILADHESLNIVEEWSTRVKPRDISKADPAALAVNGYNEAEWVDALEIKPALEVFLQKTSNKVLVGHNLPMDWMWLNRALFENKLLESMKFTSGQFYYNSLDTVSMAYTKLRNVAGIEKFSLEELSQYFGIQRARSHRAMDDARATYELFVKLLNY